MATYFETAPLLSPLEGFFSIAAVTLAQGDVFEGSIGTRGAAGTDTIDSVEFVATEGATYTFVLTGFDADVDLALFLETADPASAPQISRADGDASDSLTLTFTATETGDMSLSLSSVFAGITDNTPYTLSVLEIAAPGTPSLGDDNLVGNMTSDSVNLLAGDDVYIALGGSDLVIGGDGNDMINGVCGNDRITGDAGNDTLLGGNGRDLLDGGTGDDSLNGNNNEDTLLGGAGDDILNGDKGNDLLEGGDGDDTLNGGKEQDTLVGGEGADVFVIGSGSGFDQINDFEQGVDRIDVTELRYYDMVQLTFTATDDGSVLVNFGTTNSFLMANTMLEDIDASDFILNAAPVNVATDEGDVMNGSIHADLYEGGSGDDLIIGNDGDDNLAGNGGVDSIYGGDGHDTLDSGDGKDRVYGNDGNDLLIGGSDNDLLSGGNGDDTVEGGTHNDRLYGGAGQDQLFGDSGNDKLYGGADDDLIEGGSGKDLLMGEDGNDTLDGGSSSDTMIGGSGADTFVFAVGMYQDVITDFEDGQDILDFSEFGFTDISDLTLSQIGSDVVVHAGGSDYLTLQGVELVALDNGDFLWADGVFIVG